jgi:predicted GIY-YIG superfamily endonuclease
MTESFHVYILQNEAKNFTYKGMTNDLERRLAEHNRGACQSTKPYRPLKIVYFETYDTRKEGVQSKLSLCFHRYNLWLFMFNLFKVVK